MIRNNFIRTVFILVALFPLGMEFVHAAQTSAVLRGARIAGFVAKPVTDPCAGVAVGDPCPNGVLYAGTGFAGLGSYKYMTTPGNCSDFVDNATPFTPTCDGTTDVLIKPWANDSGTTAYSVVTGVTSVTDGPGNTTTLATSYTDTDAARYCQNMTYPAGGYADWYLPAENELELVLYAMHAEGKGNLADGELYWSSTEYNFEEARALYSDGGGMSNRNKTHYDNNIRCVRKY